MRRVLASLVATTSLLPVAPAPGARAGSPVWVYAVVWVNRWINPTTPEICAEGQVDDGEWVYGVFTWSFTGTVPTPPQQTYPAPLFPFDCVNVSIAGQPEGYVQANLSYVGAGTSDVTGTADLFLIWSPATGVEEGGFGTYRTPPHTP